MAGRAHGAEGVLRFALRDRVDGMERRADRAHRRLPRAGRDGGVHVDARQALGGNRLADRLDIALGMAEQRRLRLGERRLDALQRGKILVVERRVQRAQPVRPLRVADRRQMVEEAA